MEKLAVMWANEAQPEQEASPTRARDTQVGGQHYKVMGVEPWDVVDSWPWEQRVGYYRGGALKYLMRLGLKDEMVQEAEKARHYMDKLIEVLQCAD
jgi:hypothetical protein